MIFNLFKRKEPEGKHTFETRHMEAKKVIAEILSGGAKTDGIIVIRSIDRVPEILAGGIDNEYEALGLLQNAMIEINKNGLPLL